MNELYQVLKGIMYHYSGQLVHHSRLRELFTENGIERLIQDKYVKKGVDPMVSEQTSSYSKHKVLLDSALYNVNRNIVFVQSGGWISKENLLKLFTARTIKDLLDYGFIEPSTWDGTIDSAIKNQIGLLDENVGKNDNN
jgi:hypothetical protein